MKDKIKKLIEKYEDKVKKIQESDFDPSLSGNFDYAYDRGLEDGEVYGKLEILREVMLILKLEELGNG